MRLTIIDGHNLILTVQSLAERLEFDGKRASREEAEDLVLRWAERSGDMNAHVVYDGEKFPGSHPGNRDEGPLRVRFTDPPAEADDLIVFGAKEAVDRGDTVTVVTADKDLGRKAKRAGARVVSTEDFFFELKRAPLRPEKEEHFTDEQMAEIETAILEREEEEPEAESEPAPEPGEEDRSAPGGGVEWGKSIPEKKAAPRIQKPNKEERRTRFAERMKRRAARGASQPSKSKKKKRGF
jgi:predicted RNA-binding protein with PIN domain